MTIETGIATFVGAFIFPFMVRMLWDTFVEKYDLVGGLLAAIFIVGTAWVANHGLVNPFMTQTGLWVDMALAVGVGAFTATAVKGGNIKKGLPNVVAAILAGIVGGYILSLFL